MKKDDYLKVKEDVANKIKELNEQLSNARECYINENSPCKKGELIDIVLSSGRKAKGIANTFFIWKDGNVYLSSYKDINDSEKVKYITLPTKSIEINK